MKQQTSHFSFLALMLLFITALLSGCSKDVDYTMHNPTDNPISVRIDDKTYSIDPMQAVDVSFSPGKHELETNVTGKVSFIIYSDRKGGLLNPTLSDYIIVREVFVTGLDKAKNFRPPTTLITLDQYQFEGSFKKVNSLFISEQWTYDVKTAFPKEIKISESDKRGGNIVSKIFSEKDFIDYYKFNYGNPSVVEQSEPPLDVQQILALNTALPLPVFKDEKMQQASQSLRELYEQYITAAEAGQQTKLQEQFHELMMNFTKETATLRGDIGKEENEKANDFVSIIANTFGFGALITSLN